MLKEALSFHNSGQLDAAVAIYTQLVDHDPNNARILYLLGTAHVQLENYEIAISFLEKAILSDSNFADAYNSLGLAFDGLDDKDKAEKSYKTALEINNDSLDALNNLSALYARNSENEKLETLLIGKKQIISGHSVLLAYLGLVYSRLDDHGAAFECYEASWNINPGDEKVLRFLLDSALKLKRIGVAISYAKSSSQPDVNLNYLLQTLEKESVSKNILFVIDALLEIAPRWELWRKKACVLRELGFYEDSEKAALNWLKEDNDRVALLFLAELRFYMSDYYGSAQYYLSSLRKNALSSEALVGLGVIVMRAPAILRDWISESFSLKKNDELYQLVAEILNVLENAGGNKGNIFCFSDDDWFNVAKFLFLKAINLNEYDKNAYNNLGYLLRTRGMLSEAEMYMRRAIENESASQELKYNLSLCLLAQGKLEEGWELYENRWGTEAQKKKPYDFKEWSGDDLGGNSLFVYSEQGIGDEILFSSCFADLIDSGHNLLIECDPRLVGLFGRSFPGVKFIGKTSKEQTLKILSEHNIEFQCAAGSLPFHFRKKLSDFSLQENGCLVADENKVLYWKRKLDKYKDKTKVGFSWKSGFTGFGRVAPAELHYWARLLKDSDSQFVNLQYGDVEEDIAYIRQKLGQDIIVFPQLDLFHDIDEMAALICALDVVVSIGNVTSVLAGALGKNIIRVRSVRNAEPFCFGQNYYPWFPSMNLVYMGDNEVDDALSKLSEIVDS